MKRDYELVVTVTATPQQAFDRINQVTQWWTEDLEGASSAPGDEFVVRFGDVHYSRQRIIEFVPARKLTWLVTDSRLNFLKGNKAEWTDTKIVFDILAEGNKTVVRFTHIGLIPGIACYDDCTGAWSEYILGSLATFIDTGAGRPAKKEVLVR